MATLYKIRGWSDHFEVADSRKVRGPLSWFPAPTDFDGNGYTLIAERKDRAELLAAWYLMLAIAAKKPAEERGKLGRDGWAYTAKDLSRLTRFPERIFENALNFFSSKQVAWLECEEIGQSDLGLAPDSSGGAGSASGSSPNTGQDRTGQDKTGQDCAGSAERERNPVFDALASAEGTPLDQVTKAVGRRIGTALAEIRAASPDVTPEEVTNRAANYRRHFPTVTLTASGLAKWWAKCSNPPQSGSVGGRPLPLMR